MVAAELAIMARCKLVCERVLRDSYALGAWPIILNMIAAVSIYVFVPMAAKPRFRLPPIFCFQVECFNVILRVHAPGAVVEGNLGLAGG